MNDRVEIYSKLSESDAQKYEKIDRFLALSERYSPKSVKKNTNITCIVFGVFAAFALAVPFLAKDFTYIIFSVLIALFCVCIIYVTVSRSRNNFYPELERTNSIIESDGLDTVCDALAKAAPVDKSDILSDGRYIFVIGKAMCRIENITDIYLESVSQGRSRIYYATAKVADEIGVHDIRLKRLSFNANKELEKIKNDIMFMKIIEAK